MGRKKKELIPPTPATPRSYEQNRLGLRRLTRGFYDLQRLRLQTAGRTYKRSETAPIELHPDDVAVLAKRAENLLSAEKSALAEVAAHLKSFNSFYVAILSDKTRYKGIGPTMAGVILSEFDIRKAENPSKFFRFAGIAPVLAKRCKKCHTVVSEAGATLTHAKVAEKLCALTGKVLKGEDVYDSGKAERPVRGEKLHYNSFLKTKLVGVLAGVLLQVGSPWRKFYDDYKHRKQTAGWGVSDAHRDAASKRYMVKMLLLQIWLDWRRHEGLEIRTTYHQEYQGGHTSGLEPIEIIRSVAPTPAVDDTALASLEAEAEAQILQREDDGVDDSVEEAK